MMNPNQNVVKATTPGKPQNPEAPWPPLEEQEAYNKRSEGFSVREKQLLDTLEAFADFLGGTQVLIKKLNERLKELANVSIPKPHQSKQEHPKEQLPF